MGVDGGHVSGNDRVLSYVYSAFDAYLIVSYQCSGEVD